MFVKWVKEYQRLSEKWRFVSKLATFIISIVTIFGFYDIIRFSYQNGYDIERLSEIHLFPTAIVFQILILMVFSTRFVLLFFKTNKAFWFAQSLCFTSLIIVAIYYFISIPEKTPFGIYSTYADPIFAHSTHIFSGFGMCYLILSPLKTLIISIIAWFKSK